MTKKKRAKKQRRPLFGELFNDVLEVPEEVAYDLPRITLIGNLKLDIENHRGIIGYDSNEVRISVNNGYLRAQGHHLCLKNISLDEVLIEGEISQIGVFLDSSAATDGEEMTEKGGES